MATNEDSGTQCLVWVPDITKEPQKMLMPICGYEYMPLVSLEEAVAPLVSILPRILDYVYVAKQRCELVPADGLTRDESSAIILYTMEWEPKEKCLYFVLNSTLRSEDRRKLQPWLSYLKLIFTALSQLPSHRHFIYRAIEMDISEHYPKGKTFVWWTFSSCTSSIEVLENQQFFEKTVSRTLFIIDCSSGKDISHHSYNHLEDEILILPARQFTVKSCFQPASNLHMIHLKELEAPICLLQPVAIDCNSNKSVSGNDETV
jgi:hypothetical protein